MLNRYAAKWAARGNGAQSGDTLIEVLFAITVLSLAIVMSLSIMNQGTAASLRSLQITLVRQEIDSQAEALRFLNSAYVATYTTGYAPATSDLSPAAEYYRITQAIQARNATSVSAFGSEGESCRAIPDSAFIMNARTAQYQRYDASRLVPAQTYAQLVYRADGTLNTSEGVWIEAVRSNPSGGTRYTDFHIRACWGAPGANVPMNLGTIVRLYDPAN